MIMILKTPGYQMLQKARGGGGISSSRRIGGFYSWWEESYFQQSKNVEFLLNIFCACGTHVHTFGHSFVANRV